MVGLFRQMVGQFWHGRVIQALYTDIMTEMQNTFEKLVLR